MPADARPKDPPPIHPSAPPGSIPGTGTHTLTKKVWLVSGLREYTDAVSADWAPPARCVSGAPLARGHAPPKKAPRAPARPSCHSGAWPGLQDLPRPFRLAESSRRGGSPLWRRVPRFAVHCVHVHDGPRPRCHQMASNWPPRQSPPSTAAMSCWLLRLRSAWRHRHVVSAHSWLLTRSCVIALRGLVRGHHGGRAAHGRSPRGRACYNWLSPYVGGRPKGHTAGPKAVRSSDTSQGQSQSQRQARPCNLTSSTVDGRPHGQGAACTRRGSWRLRGSSVAPVLVHAAHSI